MSISNDDFAVVEALKQLKARYCRLLDTKDWRPAFRIAQFRKVGQL